MRPIVFNILWKKCFSSATCCCTVDCVPRESDIAPAAVLWLGAKTGRIFRPLKTSALEHLLRHMYSICTVYVQYLYASEASKYCTYTVHILYNGQ